MLLMLVILAMSALAVPFAFSPLLGQPTQAIASCHIFSSLYLFILYLAFLKATSLFTEDLTQVLTLAHPAIFYPMGIFSALNIPYTCPFFFLQN